MTTEQTRGVVYTETVIHSAPEAFIHDAPYQMVIVSLEGGGRRTGRVRAGGRLQIGRCDPAEVSEQRTQCRQAPWISARAAELIHPECVAA